MEKGVALVIGGGQGVGREIVVELCQSEWKVYYTDKYAKDLIETYHQAINLNGDCIPVLCDHRIDSEVAEVFNRIHRDGKCLTLLVNNAWSDWNKYPRNVNFWMLPLNCWDDIFDPGVRSIFTCAQMAVREMLRSEKGVIINISGAARQRSGDLIYDTLKAAADKLTVEMDYELRETSISIVSLSLEQLSDQAALQGTLYSNQIKSESRQLIGRVVSALASDPDVLTKSGRLLEVTKLASDYGVTNLSGQALRQLTGQYARI